jgi:VWFA-related protein
MSGKRIVSIAGGLPLVLGHVVLGSAMLAPVWAAQEKTPAAPPAAQVAGTQAPAQTAEGSQPVTTFHTNANLVLVDVVVRSKQQPVLGLKEEDFQVREEGKPQKISVFEEHRATDAEVVAAAPKLPPHVFSNAPQYTLNSAANILLMDGLNTPLADQVYVRRRMLKYLSTVPPGTRIAVFALGSRLHILTGFTTDTGEVAKALTTGHGQAERSPVLDPDFDNAITLQMNLAQALGLSGVAVSGIDQFLSDTQNFEVGLREEMTIDALDTIARYLSTIPGRKNLIWFSASFPLRFLQGGQNPNMDPMADYSGMVKRTAELLALARVAVYPVDSRGLLNTPSSDASSTAGVANEMLAAPNGASGQGSVGSSGGAGTGSTSIGSGAGGNAGIGSYSMDQLAGQTVSVAAEPGVGGEVDAKDQTFISDQAWDHFNMEQIAKETGGKAFYNQNGLGQAVGEAVENGSSYYTIGYAPQDRNYNGALRNINVDVAGGHYDLEYRHAYFADDPAQEVKWTPGRHNALIDAMQRGSPSLSQVIFNVRVLPASDPAVKNEPAAQGPAGSMAGTLKNPQRYVIDYWIDPRGLDHKTLPDGSIESQVELTEVAYDDEGVRANYADQGLSLTQTAQQAEKSLTGGLGVHEQIDLPPGRIYLRVGVHDLLSGRIGTAEIPVVAGK